MNRKALLILGWGLIAVALVAALLLIVNPAEREAEALPTVTPPPIGGGSTAQEAYSVLQPWTANWAEESGLVSLSTSLQKETSTQGGWTFQLYSPNKKKIAIANVNGPDVSLLKEQTALYPQQTLPPEAWELNSNTLFARWWAERGAVIWSDPSAQSLYFQLGRKKNGAFSWTISVLTTAGQVLDFWEIDALTAEPITSTQ